MKSFKFSEGPVLVALACLALALSFSHRAAAQFPSSASATSTVATAITTCPGDPGCVAGPLVVGQMMPQKDDAGRIAIFQAAPVHQGGGVIQLSAFGWLEPYVDSIVQGLLYLGLAWLGKSKYTQWMDQSARDSLEAFLKNSASSLIADGFVHMEGKVVAVHDAALATEISTAMDRIPDAMKRFGITPGVLEQKIVDAIPQTPAGAAIVAKAHADAVPMPPVPSAS